MAEHLPVLFRDRTADGAVAQAKAWAREEGLTLRTIGRVVVAAIPDSIALPTLPEAPTLPLWSGVAL